MTMCLFSCKKIGKASISLLDNWSSPSLFFSDVNSACKLDQKSARLSTSFSQQDPPPPPLRAPLRPLSHGKQQVVALPFLPTRGRVGRNGHATRISSTATSLVVLQRPGP